ncbi:MAG: response regulator [Halobacteriovoraceae bacterium]|nr:response regulator [Halobacteriovoraceae bacterium]
MSTSSIINYNKNQLKVKQLKIRFVIFSVVALLVVVVISALSIKYHSSVSSQQASIRKIHDILSRQASYIKEISILGNVFDDGLPLEQLIEVRKQIKAKVEELNGVTEELASWILKSDGDSLNKLEEKLKNKKINSKVLSYIHNAKTLLRSDSTREEVSNSIRFLTNNSGNNPSGLSDYINEMIILIEEQYNQNISLLDQIVFAIICLCVLEVFLVWFLLFRPLNSTIFEQNEQLLDAIMKVESASRSRTDFLANVSHEIRTPMTAILGYAELLQKETSMTEKKKNIAIAIINQNASHLLSLLDEVLDVSKIEAGKFELKKEVVHLSKLLKEVYLLLIVKAKEKNLKLIFETNENVPKYVRTDAKRLKQILFNIIGNAIKFTDVGEICLDLTYEYKGRDKKLIFRIKDTGMGIPKEKLKKIFAPFEQGSTAANREHTGTGLGLVLSRGLARKMGGDVVVQETTIGKGTIFRIEIDPGRVTEKEIKKVESHLSEEKNDEKNSKLNLKNRLQGKSILVVDDAKENARLFETYLAAAGAKVEIAYEGKKVLEKTQKHTFDLILLDLQMPGMDGFQVIEKLKKEGYKGTVSALTAHAMNEEYEKTKKAGFDGHITKPISSQSLVENVYKLVSQKPSAELRP